MENALKRSFESLITEILSLEEESPERKNLLNFLYIKAKNEKGSFTEILKICKNNLSSNNDIKRKSSLGLIHKILNVIQNLNLDFSDITDLINLSIEKMSNVVLAPIAVKIFLGKLIIKFIRRFYSNEKNFDYRKKSRNQHNSGKNI